MTTRILLALAVLQTLAILYLAHAVLGLSREFDAQTGADTAPRVAAGRSAEPERPVSTAPAAGLTEDRLRQIIAEEIGARRDALPSPGAGSPSADPAEDVATGEFDYATAAVEQAIDYHISVGAISPSDMEDLQAQIARLEPAGRQRMLQKLVKAMNDGQIDGRL